MRFPDAYERLLMDVVRGDATLFMRRDKVEAAWAWAEPNMEAWSSRPDHPRPYLAGSWGPTVAIALIERDGRTWHEEVGQGARAGLHRHGRTSQILYRRLTLP